MLKELQERWACCVEWTTHPSPTASPASIDDEGENGILDGVTEEEVEGENQVDVTHCIEGLIEFATQAKRGRMTQFRLWYLVTAVKYFPSTETSTPLKIQIQCMQQREHGTMSGWQCVQTSAKTVT